MITVGSVRRTPVSSSYRFLLLLSMTINYLLQIFVTSGVIPIFTLPLSGCYSVGMLADYMSMCAMITISLALGISYAGSTTLLFLYRHNSLLETSKPIGYAVHFLLLVICILPTISFPIACSVSDQITVKAQFCSSPANSKYAQTIPKFWEDKVLVTSLSCTAFKISMWMGVVSSATVITMISVTVYRMIFSLRVDLLSKLFLKKHKSLMTTLIVQTLTNYLIFFTPGLVLVFCFWKELALPGLANICTIMISLSDPCSILAMIICNHDYRKYVTQHLRLLTNGFHRSRRRVHNVSTLF